MEQEFLALAAGADDGHGPEARQLPRELRDIGHGGELQQQIRAGVHELRQQRQHIRLTVRQAEDLPAVLGASGWVQEDEIGAEPAQYFLEIARHQLPAAEPDVRDAELPEVLLRRLSQRRLHLVVQHLAEQPAECPAVHSHSACQIRYPAAFCSNGVGDAGLYKGGFLGGTLLGGEAAGEAEGGDGVPGRDLLPETPTALDRRHGEIDVDIRKTMTRQQQR